MTREELTTRITRISEISGDNEEVMNTLREIQDGFTDSGYTREQVYNPNGETWQESYNNMVTKYRNTFFGGDAGETKPEAKEQAEEITFDDIFKEN